MQRLRQVRKAALHLLLQQYGIQEANVALTVTCASFGGLTAPLAPLFYPKEFHSATGAAYSGAHRSMPSDLAGHVFATSLLGDDGSAHVYNLRDTLDFSTWCTLEGTDYASMTFTNRWVKGHLQRPVYFMIGDEDLVSHGTEWLPILTDGQGPPREQRQHFAHSTQNVFNETVSVFWSLVAKVGHSEPRMNKFVLEGRTPQIETNDLSLPIEVMIQKGYEEIGHMVRDIDDLALGRKILDPLLPSLDPNRIAMTHRGGRTFTPGTNQGLLTLNTSFKQYGQGTWLGINESLKVVRLDVQDDRDSVFVGSADGFVTRLKMEGRPTSAPTVQPLVEVVRSKKLGQPYSLGYGTWGLDVGDIDPTRPGLEVAVASYNRVALFEAGSMELIRQVDMPNWEYDNPSKLQVADMLGGNEKEIVFRTFHNHLVIMDHLLDIKFEHAEAGIIDLAIGPNPAPRANNPLKRPVYLLSARGHVVRLEFDQNAQATNAGILAGCSPLQYGGLRDIDVVTYQGQERLGVLVVPHEGTSDAMRFFSVTDCDRVAQFGDLMRDPPPSLDSETPPLSARHADPGGDMEPSYTTVAGHGGDRFVISSGGWISVWDGQYVLGMKDISSFIASHGHGCVQAGEIDPTSPGQEVVVSTITGKVVWFKLSDLTTPGPTITGSSFDRTSPSHFVTEAGVVYEDRCNMSLAATWVLAPKPATATSPASLVAVDRTSTWWEVNPVNGNPTWKRWTIPFSNLIPLSTLALNAGSGGGPGHEWQVLNHPQVGWILASRPYVPISFQNYTWFQPDGDFRPFVSILDGNWVVPPGGSFVDTSNSRVWVAWWQRYGQFADLVQCVNYDRSDTTPNDVRGFWSSTGAPLSGGVPPVKWPPGPNARLSLKTEYPGLPNGHMAVRVANVLKDKTSPQVIVSASGGRVSLLDGDNGTLLAESPDYGFGGTALAVADIHNNGNDGLSEILFAPMYSPIEQTGGSVRSYLHILTSNATGSGLIVVPGGAPVPIGEVGNADFHGYGTSGIAIIDHPLVPAVNKAILVTTLNGELVVFGQTNGVIHAAPIYRGVFEGSLGGFGSIVIADLDASHAKPELYIAGSSGIRRFDFP